MATLTIRDLDEPLEAKLRARAAAQCRSIEAEVLSILRLALDDTDSADRLGSRIHSRFAALGGVELALPGHEDAPRTADV